MRRYKGLKDETSVFEALPILLLVMIAAFIPVIIVLGPAAIDYIRSAEFQIPSWLPEFPVFPVTQGNESPPQAQPQTLSPDALHYYSLKNLSCKTLGVNFMIEAKDITAGSMQGISGAEETLAISILKEYEIPAGNHTTIWKDGRIYQCNPNCTMNLLGDAGWQAFLDSLAEIRSGCAHFGRTELPLSINQSRLLTIEDGGRTEKNGFRCELFLIRGNAAYAKSLMNSSIPMDENQRALLWLLSHQAAPIQECLDDGTGVLVFRNVTLDLTPSYNFDYAPGGYMHVSQQTDVTYYTAYVPETFLALPK
jgi:hypothetical protein